jgi:hypothetical protein
MALRENPKKAAARVTLRSGFANTDGTGREVAFKLIVPYDTVKVDVCVKLRSRGDGAGVRRGNFGCAWRLS